MLVKDLIAKATRVLPDTLYVQLDFFRHLKRFPNLKHPKTFNEKLQWLKIHDRKPEYTRMVDKYEAKQFVAERIGKQYIIPTLGVWDRFDDIDFDSLPKQFVLKCTHDSGGLVICRDKSKFDRSAARQRIEESLKRNYYYYGREWPYKNVRPRIIAEVYLEDENTASGLTDYKFFCFHGEPKLIYLSQGLEDHSTARISFYDMQGDRMSFRRSDFAPMEAFSLPKNFDELKRIAQVLAKETGCLFMRVDLYSVNGKIYFSELTFSPCSGMVPFEPEEWDYKLGEWIRLPLDKE